MDKRPLVSFCITCYNQERYIVDTLNAALKQTYRPLEIVISDDCSSDGTNEVIQSHVEMYRKNGGDIPIVYNRNLKNLGNLGNWLLFGGLAHGELLVKADGDDYSLPERCAKIVEAWTRNGRRAKCISHRAIGFDRRLRSLGLIGSTKPGMNWGCCCAYTPDCWRFFDDNTSFNHDAIDDVVFSRRVRLFDEEGSRAELVIPDILVYYRLGAGITTNSRSHRMTQLVAWKAMINSRKNLLADLNSAKGRVSQKSYSIIEGEIHSGVELAEKYVQLLSSEKFKQRLAAFRAIKVEGFSSFLRHLIYLLPRGIGDVLLNTKERLARCVQIVRNGQKLDIKSHE